MNFDLSKYNEMEVKIIQHMANSLKASIKSKCNLNCDACNISSVCEDYTELNNEVENVNH